MDYFGPFGALNPGCEQCGQPSTCRLSEMFHRTSAPKRGASRVLGVRQSQHRPDFIRPYFVPFQFPPQRILRTRSTIQAEQDLQMSEALEGLLQKRASLAAELRALDAGIDAYRRALVPTRARRGKSTAPDRR
jgi:hypothetical protein